MAQQLVTWDNIKKDAGVILTNENLTAKIPSYSSTVLSKFYRSGKGKWYWEVTIDIVASTMIGIIKSSEPFTSSYNSSNAMYYHSTGSTYGKETKSYGSAFVTGDVVSVLLDLDIGTIEFWKNGVSQGVAFSNVGLLGEVTPSATVGSTSASTITANFGDTPFKYLIPAGYKSYNKMSINKILISSSSGLLSVEKGGYTDNLIPTMTSNTAPSGIASASSFDGAYEAWKAFDKKNTDITTSWISSGTAKTGWLAFEFPKDVVIRRYALSCVNQNGWTTLSPKTWTFEGSNDNFVTFDILDTRQNVSDWVLNVRKEYSFINSKAYKKYRINVSEINSTGQFGISELEMFGFSNSIVKSVSNSEQNFINHGMDKPLELDTTTEISTRAFIEQSSIPLGNGKVFKTSIDTSKIPIKNVTIK